MSWSDIEDCDMSWCGYIDGSNLAVFDSTWCISGSSDGLSIVSSDLNMRVTSFVSTSWIDDALSCFSALQGLKLFLDSFIVMPAASIIFSEIDDDSLELMPVKSFCTIFDWIVSGELSFFGEDWISLFCTRELLDSSLLDDVSEESLVLRDLNSL